jgi:hypothetical protein
VLSAGALSSWGGSSGKPLFFRAPVPQQPPQGYEVEQSDATLQWNRGTLEKPIELEVPVGKINAIFVPPTHPDFSPDSAFMTAIVVVREGKINKLFVNN